MEDLPVAGHKNYDLLSPQNLKDLLVKRDEEIERLKANAGHLENQVSLLKSQVQQAKLNYDALDEHYKYKENSFKLEKESLERQIAMMREEYEDKVASGDAASRAAVHEEGNQHYPGPARYLRLPERPLLAREGKDWPRYKQIAR